MKKKSFAIIGGGLTGCASALYLRSKGHDVTIYEKDNNLGGVAKDLNFDNKNYFNGPNYLDPNSLLINLIKKEKFLNKLLSTKELLYGSYTDIFNKKHVSHDFAHPVTTNNFKKKKYLPSKIKNLLERINLYPLSVSKNLILWSLKFENKIETLHDECSHLLGFGRIYFKNDNIKISKFKKNSKLLDSLLGIPNFNKSNNKFCIPKQGYDSFFKFLKKYLENKKVKIELSKKISVKKVGKKLILTLSKKEVKVDYFIWASNPVPLISSMQIGKLDNPIIKTEIYAFDFNENETKLKNRYIQVFSKKSNIFRIYFFNLKGKNKVVIELVLNKKKIDTKKELRFASEILSKFNYNYSFKEPVYKTKQIRHILFTIGDYKKFMKFEKMSKNLNVIGGGWYLTSSKAKMDYIKKMIDRLDL